MKSLNEFRKKYLGAPNASDEDMRILQAVHEFVDKEVMPCRQQLEGGWHRNQHMADETFILKNISEM